MARELVVVEPKEEKKKEITCKFSVNRKGNKVIVEEKGFDVDIEIGLVWGKNNYGLDN